MKKQIEYILNSILLGLSIVLGLSFWLNTKFNFNIFSEKHWAELAKLQASHTPINIHFYISIGIAIFLFITGLYIIHRARFRRFLHIKEQQKKQTTQEVQTDKDANTLIVESSYKPARLVLPKNLSSQHIIEEITKTSVKPINAQSQNNSFDNELKDILIGLGYQIKNSVFIKGFKPNILAIGPGEQFIIGGVDCDLQKMKNAIQALKDTFLETLEDVEINVFGFVLNSTETITEDTDIQILKNLDDVKLFIGELHNNIQPDEEGDDSFDSYSEYIDTVLQYINNI